MYFWQTGELILPCSVSVNVPPLEYCQIELSQDNHDALVYAVKNHYWYQMYIGMSDCLIC